MNDLSSILARLNRQSGAGNSNASQRERHDGGGNKGSGGIGVGSGIGDGGGGAALSRDLAASQACIARPPASLNLPGRNLVSYLELLQKQKTDALLRDRSALLQTMAREQSDLDCARILGKVAPDQAQRDQFEIDKKLLDFDLSLHHQICRVLVDKQKAKLVEFRVLGLEEDNDKKRSSSKS
ncbi:MAG: hypothetical protein SGCHY_004256 [Lobulomycetales sp.]